MRRTLIVLIVLIQTANGVAIVIWVRVGAPCRKTGGNPIAKFYRRFYSNT